MTLQVGVKVFLKNPEGKILLLLRSDKYGTEADTWDIPGGRIDPGSTLLDNLKREVNEETQLDLASEPILVAAQDILKFEDKHVVRLTYTAEAIGETVLDGVEHTEYQWVTPEEMKALPNLDRYVQELLAQNIAVL
ncbi:MAG: MutT related protein [Parcubacteria group bacterium]|nr:MutT related protein [Parcubacteria group bacterium]